MRCRPERRRLGRARRRPRANIGGRIATENARAGTTDWLITQVAPVAVNVRDDRYQRQRSIEGFVSHASIRAGETLTGYVSTNPAAPYRVDVYRMGWYGGKGGRLMTTLPARPGVIQPEPVEGDKQLMEARWTLVVRDRDSGRLAQRRLSWAS